MIQTLLPLLPLSLVISNVAYTSVSYSVFP